MKFNLLRLLIGFILTLASYAGFAQVDPPARAQYFDKITQFGRLTDYQLSSFNDFINSQSDLSLEAKRALETALKAQRASMWSEINILKDLYEKSFLTKTASKEDRKALVYRESNLSIAIHRQLSLVHGFLSKHAQRTPSTKSIEALSQQISALAVDLQAGKSISVPASMGLQQVFQSGKNISVSICKMLVGFCMRKPLSQLMDSLNEKNFLRSQAYDFAGIEQAKAVLDQNSKAVFILIGNHDQPLMDIALARKVSLALGSEHHLTMTRKSVYPVPPPEKAGDVVFVVDNDPKSNPVQKSLDLLTHNIIDKQNSRVSLAVYPEGMLPYTGGQMPMTVKEGAFVIARKISNQLSQQGIPVYLVQMKTNIVEHLTSVNPIPARIHIESIEKVPDNPIDRSQPDLWIESRRLRAENSFNSHRGETQINIFNLDKVPASKIPYGLEMKQCSKVFIL